MENKPHSENVQHALLLAYWENTKHDILLWFWGPCHSQLQLQLLYALLAPMGLVKATIYLAIELNVIMFAAVSVCVGLIDNYTCQSRAAVNFNTWQRDIGDQFTYLIDLTAPSVQQIFLYSCCGSVASHLTALCTWFIEDPLDYWLPLWVSLCEPIINKLWQASVQSTFFRHVHVVKLLHYTACNIDHWPQ